LWLLGALRFADGSIEEGSRDIRGSGSAATPVAGARTRALLAWLALRPGVPWPRESVAEALWPQARPSASRRLLSDTLYRLRQVLGPSWLETSDEHLRLRDEGTLWVDATAFATLADSRETSDLTAAAALYRDDLLVDVYDEWTIVPRASLRERFLATLSTLGERAAAEGNLDAAIAAWQRLTWADPLREDAYVLLIESLGAAQRPLEALAVYRRMTEVLEAELGIAPPERATRLATTLERGLAARRAVATQALRTEDVGAFVGRLPERTRLLEQLDRAAAGRGGLVVVTGPEGIGKSALLAELAGAAAGRGWRCSAGDRNARAGPLRAALAAALDSATSTAKVADLQPAWTAVAARALPGLATTSAQTTARLPNLDAGTVARAVGRLLQARAEQAPQMILVDDAERLDEDAWLLLASLHGDLARSRVLLTLALPALPENALAEDRQAQGTLHMELGGLSREELRALAGAMGHTNLGSEETRRLDELSGGNPLLALACLDAGWAHEAAEKEESAAPFDKGGDRPPLPAALETILDRQVAALDPPARRALEAAAILGRRVPDGLWRAVITETEDVAVAEGAIAALERAAVLRKEGADWRFTYGALRRGIERSMDAHRRRALHAAALQALEADPAADPSARLCHARGAMRQAERSRYALAVGEAALRTSAHSTAVMAFDEALRALPQEDLGARLQALRGRAAGHRRRADRQGQARDVALFRDLAEAVDEEGVRAEAALAASELAAITGDLAAAEQEADAGLAHAAAAGDPRLEGQLLAARAYVARDRGDLESAKQWIQAAHERFLRAEDELGIGTTLDKLANLAYYAGEGEEAARGHARAAELLERAGAVVEAANARSGLALALRHQGQWARSRRMHEQVLQLMRELDLPIFVMYQLINLANLALEIGDPLEAIEHYEQALAMAKASQDPRLSALTLNNLGAAYLELGDPATALARYSEARDVNRRRNYGRGIGYAELGRAKALLDDGRADEAMAALDHAQAAWEAAGDRVMLIENHATRVAALLAGGDISGAVEAAEEALAALREGDRATLRQGVHLAAGTAMAADGQEARATAHLSRAVRLMESAAARLPAAERERFLDRVALHRRTRRAAADAGRTVEVRLVRRDVPLGRALRDEDYVTVLWTLDLPGDEEEGTSAAMRRRRLRRLAGEAAARGAAPTDADFASALSVHRRTILRDMAQLQAEGYRLATRRRKPARG
jgi:DNA-binding SARP family transcriptional activator/tetratricopeptide (TPR) repeat protein